MNLLRWLTTRLRRRLPPPQAPPSTSMADVIAARDVMWQERLQDFDVKPKLPPGEIAFTPLLMNMQSRKCFRHEQMNGVRRRLPAPCPWEAGE